MIALFCNGVKGHAALRMSRDMNINPKSAFVLLHKLREAMGATLSGGELAGEVEIDGAYFGSRIRQTNRRGDRRQQRADDNRRRVVVVARERQGNAVPWVVDRESDAVSFIRARVASGSTVHADESGAWNILHASYPMKRVNHSVEFVSDDGACTNQAKVTSLGCAGQSSEFTTGSAAIYCKPMPTKWRGVKIIAGFPMASIGT